MSAPRHAPARDHNEKSIVDAFTAYGCKVFRKLPIDLLVICRACGKPMLVEVKNADGRDQKTPTQDELVEFGVRLDFIYDPGEVRGIMAVHQKDCNLDWVGTTHD